MPTKKRAAKKTATAKAPAKPERPTEETAPESYRVNSDPAELPPAAPDPAASTPDTEERA